MPEDGDHDCPNCGGDLSTIPDAHTFYPRGFCYQCGSCGLKVHPDHADATPEQYCEAYGHEIKTLNRIIPWQETVCARCNQVV